MLRTVEAQSEVEAQLNLVFVDFSKLVVIFKEESNLDFAIY